MAQYSSDLDRKFLPEDIDPSLCSHVIYSSIKQNGVYPLKEKISPSAGFYERVLLLKKKKPNLKVLLELAHIEYHEQIQIFNNVTKRGVFIGNVISYLRRYKFDGVNLLCTFYGCISTNKLDPEVKQAVADLVAEMRQGFDKEANGSNRLVFTVSVYGQRSIDDTIYDIPRISENVDWIVLLAYDLHGPWFGTTGHHSPLFADIPQGQSLSVHTVVRHWTKHKTHREKIVIVLPSFGKPYTLTGEETGVDAPASVGEPGPFTKDTARLAYYEICDLLQDSVTAQHLATQQRVPYLVSGNQWVGYDDVHSVIAKIVYIKKRRLGGFALYYLDYDDFTGAFCREGIYPLLRAANKRCDK